MRGAPQWLSLLSAQFLVSSRVMILWMGDQAPPPPGSVLSVLSAGSASDSLSPSAPPCSHTLFQINKILNQQQQ